MTGARATRLPQGIALLKEVFDSYRPEDFFFAKLMIVRQALEGTALKKEKKFYSKEVRQAKT